MNDNAQTKLNMLGWLLTLERLNIEIEREIEKDTTMDHTILEMLYDATGEVRNAVITLSKAKGRIE